MLCEEERPVTRNASCAWLCVSASEVGNPRASTMLEPSTRTSSARKVKIFLWLCFPSSFAIFTCSIVDSLFLRSCLHLVSLREFFHWVVYYHPSDTGLHISGFPYISDGVLSRVGVHLIFVPLCWFSLYGFVLLGSNYLQSGFWRAFGLPSAILGLSSRLWFPSAGRVHWKVRSKSHLTFPLLLANL